tara:strand:+ start:1972 stop:3270 length:1299 start_codon:yes stop_codon:yes gene_type:complete
MGIIFRKNGRPTKAEKRVLKNINSFLGSLDEAERSRFDSEKVSSGERLDEIWESIISEPNYKSIEEKKISKDLNVDEDTGEIFDDSEKDINFTNDKENNMEDAQILEEINDSSGADTTNEVPSFFNPLADPIKQRSYNKANETDVGEIEEPDFADKKTTSEKLEEINNDTPFNEEDHKFNPQAEEDEIEDEGKKEWDNVRNEAIEELPDKDKKLAAKQLVQTVLDGYEMLHELGKIFVKYPEEKIQEKAIKGEIDPTMQIPMDEHGTMTNPIEFFQTFNEQAEEAIAYDPEFGEKVRPAMERVFSKKGWGMTDEQFLMIAFGKDIAWKGVQIMTLKKTANGIMSTFEQLQKDKNEAIRQSKRDKARSPDPLQADSIITPPKEQPQPKQPQDNGVEFEESGNNSEDFGENNNGHQDEYGAEGNEIVQIHGGES